MFRRILFSLALLAAGIAQAAPPTALVSWTAPTANTDASAIVGAITYNIYVGTLVSGACALAKVQSGVATATTTVALTPGTTACVAVSAVVGGVESAQSNQATAAVPLPTPNAPSQITVVIH